MIDLHSHSYFSDGTLSPEGLIDHALICGVKVLALTDHDTVGGVVRARNHAKTKGMGFIAGIELSVSIGHHVIHVLGLDVDEQCGNLLEVVEKQLLNRKNRAIAIAKKLEVLGLENVYERVCQLSPQGGIARPHFAQLLVQQGVCKDFKAAFKRYLARGKPAYVPMQWIGLKQAVDVIRKSGGIAVIAHPLRYGFTMTKLRELLMTFKQLGGEGIEVVSGFAAEKEINLLAGLSIEYGLKASSGSDFHCPSLTAKVMGRMKPIPARCEQVTQLINHRGG